MKNRIQDYSWGSSTAIPELFGVENPEQQPMAEIWMGAHPKAPSQIVTEQGSASLLDIIRKDPKACLGPVCVEQFGENLPFLFKVLSARRALSIQSHPNSTQAKEGYQRENRQGIPLDSPLRNYKDKNHKPELIYTLTPFWAMRGFRTVPDIIDKLKAFRVPLLQKAVMLLDPEHQSVSLRRFLEYLLSLSKHDQQNLVDGVLHQLHAESAPEHFWVAKLTAQFPGDVGCLAPLFLNLLKLEPGHAMYLPAGEMHAYLEGTGIELMANSDNVLRGGLTPKHVDVPELLSTLNFEPTKVDFLIPEQINSNEDRYHTPAAEFQLSRIDLSVDGIYTVPEVRAAQVLLCTRGPGIRIITTDQNILIHRGESVFITSLTEGYRLEGEGTLFKASIPIEH